MKAGQLDAVKLFDRPPSKNVGNGLVEAVAAVDDAEDVDEAVDEVVFFAVSDVRVSVAEASESPDDEVDIGISSVVVTVPDAALLLSSCSAGCNIFHPSASLKGILVSSKSSWTRSSVGEGSDMGVGCGTPSRGANRAEVTMVGTGSSSMEAIAVGVKEKTRHSAAVQRIREPNLIGGGEAEVMAYNS